MTESQFQANWHKKAIKKGWLPLKIIQSNLNGWPDTAFLKDGKVFFIEFKSKNGRLSELQKYRIEQIRKLKFHCFIFKSKI